MRSFLVLLIVNQIPFLSHWTHLKIVWSCRRKWCIYAWSEHSVYIQMNSFPVEINIVQIRQLIPACVHFFCAYTWEHCVPRLHSFFLVGRRIIGTRARRLVKTSCLRDNNNIQAAGWISRELTVISWIRSFTVRATESNPKSRNPSKPSLETQKIMLLYCRLKLYKTRLALVFLLTLTTNGESTRLCDKWIVFGFRFKFGCAWLWLA